ncbi:MAG: haloacid dehalogenase-like hydrolase [Planctomycetia bacterium]|nr:haloacid dehalogenase-like hydrolase [Planctomycetia bacterium]
MTSLLRTAIVYDFDGTLAPHNLPEHTFLPSLGIDDNEAFWRAVKEEARARDGCEILAYMHRMLEAAASRGVSVTRDLLHRHGRSVPLFAGVEDWFAEIDEYGRRKRLEIEHYVISSGIREFIEGCPIFPRFRRVFASAYAYDEQGRAKWPSTAINYTNKTQFLFRINKGIDNVWDNSAINAWMPRTERRIPFERMLFLGDGDTDIPSMKMVRQKGGQAVAVFDPVLFEQRKSQGRLERLIAENRVDYVAAADYTRDSLLSVVVRGILGRMSLTAD